MNYRSPAKTEIQISTIEELRLTRKNQKSAVAAPERERGGGGAIRRKRTRTKWWKRRARAAGGWNIGSIKYRFAGLGSFSASRNRHFLCSMLIQNLAAERGSLNRIVWRQRGGLRRRECRLIAFSVERIRVKGGKIALLLDDYGPTDLLSWKSIIFSAVHWIFRFVWQEFQLMNIRGWKVISCNDFTLKSYRNIRSKRMYEKYLMECKINN